MNILIATSSGSLYGKKLINEFLARGIPIAAIIVLRQPPSY